MDQTQKEIEARLFALQDTKYRDFQCRLMPNVPPERMIGVRTPALRKLAREYAKEPASAEFLKLLPHRFYEENNLHACLIEQMRNYGAAVAAVNEFLPYVDNWATCDMMSPKVFAKHLPELLGQIRIWAASGQTYTVRFGIGMLMEYFLDDAFQPELLELAAGIKSSEYYVNMMVAWYFATAVAKQPEAALPYFTGRKLPVWTHNKAIQKSIESFRVPEETKKYLRTLKIK